MTVEMLAGGVWPVGVVHRVPFGRLLYAQTPGANGSPKIGSGTSEPSHIHTRLTVSPAKLIDLVNIVIDVLGTYAKWHTAGVARVES